jgi:aminoglycoside 3-N-acetyltransferase
MVHSSLSSFGHVEGGAETVIAALKAALTPEGTLMLPSYGDFRGGEYGKVQNNEVIFDVRSSPSRMGKITDVFWRQPDVRRSLHPTHCTAAWGKRRDELLAGHERCLQSCGYGTPLYKLKDIGGKILLIGVPHTSNTFIHTIEDTGPTPSTTRMLFEPKVVDYDGQIVTVPTHPHLPGLSRRFAVADEFCRERGLQREARVGNSSLRLIDARGFYDAAQEKLRDDPLYFVDAQYYRQRVPQQAAPP